MIRTFFPENIKIDQFSQNFHISLQPGVHRHVHSDDIHPSTPGKKRNNTHITTLLGMLYVVLVSIQSLTHQCGPVRKLFPLEPYLLWGLIQFIWRVGAIFPALCKTSET